LSSCIDALQLPAGYSEQGGSEEWPDPSDPAYQVPAAVYEEPAQPRQQEEQANQAQREAQPTGALPGQSFLMLLYGNTAEALLAFHKSLP